MPLLGSLEPLMGRPGVWVAVDGGEIPSASVVFADLGSWGFPALAIRLL